MTQEQERRVVKSMAETRQLLHRIKNYPPHLRTTRDIQIITDYKAALQKLGGMLETTP